MWGRPKPASKPSAQLTIEEKIALLSGAASWETVSYPDRGIIPMTLSDGPHGIGWGAQATGTA